MKYERCPNCNGKLAIPNKKRGQPVECPVCELEFVPAKVDSADDASSDPAKTKNRDNGETIPSTRNKPNIRSLPVPTAISEAGEESSQSAHFKATVPDPLLPPAKSRLDTMAPSGKNKSPKFSGPPNPPPAKRPSRSESIAATISNTDVDEPPGQPTDLKSGDVQIAPSHDSDEKSDRERRPRSTVAKIITTEAVQPLLTKEGKLPTLQLKDDVKPPKPEKSLSSNPALVGFLICASLVSTGLMLIMFTMPTSENKQTIAEARENIRQFYEVRDDEELKPYQIELREAQLAHSRGDHESEIRAYQSVMARFRAEDRNQYTGLTGSPTWDSELEDLVAILLNEAKRRKKSFLN